MHEVGWPEPAAVVDIIDKMRRRRAFSLILATVEEEGPAAEVTLMRAPRFAVGLGLSAYSSKDAILPISDALRECVPSSRDRANTGLADGTICVSGSPSSIAVAPIIRSAGSPGYDAVAWPPQFGR